MTSRLLSYTTALVLFSIGLMPQVGYTDVAAPVGVYTPAEDEPCPEPEDVVLADLDIQFLASQCEAIGVRDLFEESGDGCFYSLETECDDRGCL